MTPRRGHRGALGPHSPVGSKSCTAVTCSEKPICASSSPTGPSSGGASPGPSGGCCPPSPSNQSGAGSKRCSSRCPCRLQSPQLQRAQRRVGVLGGMESIRDTRNPPPRPITGPTSPPQTSHPHLLAPPGPFVSVLSGSGPAVAPSGGFRGSPSELPISSEDAAASAVGKAAISTGREGHPDPTGLGGRAPGPPPSILPRAHLARPRPCPRCAVSVHPFCLLRPSGEARGCQGTKAMSWGGLGGVTEPSCPPPPRGHKKSISPETKNQWLHIPSLRPSALFLHQAAIGSHGQGVPETLCPMETTPRHQSPPHPPQRPPGWGGRSTAISREQRSVCRAAQSHPPPSKRPRRSGSSLKLGGGEFPHPTPPNVWGGVTGTPATEPPMCTHTDTWAMRGKVLQKNQHCAEGGAEEERGGEHSGNKRNPPPPPKKNRALVPQFPQRQR